MFIFNLEHILRLHQPCLEVKKPVGNPLYAYYIRKEVSDRKVKDHVIRQNRQEIGGDSKGCFS